MQFSMIFEAQMADTSVANEHAVLEDCVEQARHDWPRFLEDAGNPDVPDREKSVAWFRARRR